MEKNNEILNELQNISPLIAAIGKANVFTVPEGYFDSISNTVMLSIHEDISLDSISNNTDIPAGYFDTLSDSILDKIKKQEVAELPAIFSAIKKDQLFQVPGNYFETLADSVLNKIRNTQEEETLSPVLNNLKTVQPFEVHENYFADLPAIILRKVKKQAGAKVTSLPKRFSILRYAAAAVITGILALGVYKYSNQPMINTSTDQASAQLDPSIEKGKAMDDKKFNETLNNLSADEIVNYLQNNSNETDVAVLSSNMEETSLPNEEDYLLDDKTLDNFLKDLETKTN